MPKVFVSYARDESKKVYQILAKLEKHGIKFWVDTRDIGNGKYWDEEISKAIKKCSKFLLFMSHLSMSSDNTSQEVKIASGSRKKFVLLRLDNVELPDKFKYALEGIQWTEYSSRRWKSEILSGLGGNQKFFQKPKPSPTLPVQLTTSLPKKAPKPKSVIAQLQRIFSTSETLHSDQYTAAISKLEELRLIVSSHWINPALAYNELVPRVYFLGRIDSIRKLIQDDQDACPLDSSIKRQLIQNELEELLQELNRKNNK